MRTVTGLVFAGLSSTTSAALAHEDDPCEDDAELEEIEVPSRAIPARKKSLTSLRAPGFLAGGVATTVVGLVPALVGLALIVDDESRDSGMLDGMGTPIGSVSAAIGGVHFLIGIPMIVVGSEPREPGDEPPARPVVEVSARPTGADLRVSF